MNSARVGELCPTARLARACFVMAIACCACSSRTATRAASTLVVWHSYRGDEQRALARLVAIARLRRPDVNFEVLAVPFDAYAPKLENAIPHGHGPDVFIDAHERLASFRARGLVAPIEPGDLTRERAADTDPAALAALTDGDRLWGWPLALKCVALYVSRAHVAEPPRTFDDLVALRSVLSPTQYPLVYEVQSAYLHAAIAHAFGSGLTDRSGRDYVFHGPGAERSVQFVRDLVRSQIVPDEADGALVTQLFATGRAAAAISGPWLAAELPQTMRYTVIPLPDIRAIARAPRPFVTVEAAFVSPRSRRTEAAQWFARFLTEPDAAEIRARVGRQVVASQSAWRRRVLRDDGVLVAFREAARVGVVMPTHPHVRIAFEPALRALRRALRGDVSVHDALEQGRRRFEDATRPLPARRDPRWILIALGAFALALAAIALRKVRDAEFRSALRASLPAYRWVAHAALAVGLLVVAPLLIGAATSLFAGRDGELFYVGVANYWEILRARGAGLFSSGSFYIVLLVTLAWTLVNIALHVAIGVSLALLLARPALALRGLYRVLLILPWAVPSYVTALAWKGMFHRQFGAVNAIVSWLGGTPISWFSRFSTSFAANVATNVWLGFPFMMVVALGVLATIPKDLYEAAEVDGATAWQKFRLVTWPLLYPAMVPAVVLGSVWTFNMFNVIYLVSGGEPDGETEILVTEAYRWAFTRQAQYGYASAYAVLIFGLLVFATSLRRRLTPTGRSAPARSH